MSSAFFVTLTLTELVDLSRIYRTIMSWIPWSYLKYSSNRNFHTSRVNPEKEVSKPEVNIGSDDINALPLRRIDKRLFVWSGKYKRIEDVPDRASRAAVAKAQSVCRIKACNYMMVAVIILAGMFIALGKKNAEKGITLTTLNQEWHKEYNKKYEEQNKK